MKKVVFYFKKFVGEILLDKKLGIKLIGLAAALALVVIVLLGIFFKNPTLSSIIPSHSTPQELMQITPTFSPTPTFTPTPTPTLTQTLTPTSTSRTSTFTPTPTQIQNSTPTPIVTSTPTSTPTSTLTPTPTLTATSTPFSIPTPTQTPTPAPTPTPTSNIKGNFNATPIDAIENSLELVFTDSLNDYTNPGGGEPPGGVYDYPPIDTHQVYAGVRNGRLYIKWTIAGNIPSQRETVGDNIIKSVVYNLGVDTNGDLDDVGEINGCYGAETHLQINFSYHDNGDIWINPWYQAKFTGMGEGEDGCQYEKTGGGLMHSSNGGLGKNYFIFSYNLSDLANTVAVGNDIHFDISSEAESNLYHHYSYDQNFNENRRPIWVLWRVKEI